MRPFLIALLTGMWALTAFAAPHKPRARELGIPFDGKPGALNAITDVAGVEVGQVTLISGDGPSIRTGVTAVLPRGKASKDAAFAGWFSENGNGEMTGTAFLEEFGLLYGPVMLTNTHSVGTVRDAVIAWRLKHGPSSEEGYSWSLPVVAETWDGDLNDINGFHVKPEHVFQALDEARGGPVLEGNVGGGTGDICYEMKGGMGTASRVVEIAGARYTVDILVQCNYGVRDQLRVAGVPVGAELAKSDGRKRDTGSIIGVVATDAPLLPNQLKALARRVPLGLARDGSYSGDGSGDLFVSFSTANPTAGAMSGVRTVTALANEELDPLFLAVVQASEEAVINALVAAETMKGREGVVVESLPVDRLRQALKKYGRMH